MMNLWQKRVFGDTAIFILMSLVVFLYLFPLLCLLNISIKPFALITSPTFSVVFKPTLYHFKYLFTGPQPILLFLFNSLIIAVSVTIFSLIIGSLAAYAFSRIQHSRTPGLMFWMITTRMVPPVAFAIPLYMMILKMGLLDKLPAIMLAHTIYCLPFVVWIMKNYFDKLPIELEEAAMLDGCTIMGSLFKVVLPISKPGLVAAGVLTFSSSLGEFFFALIFSVTQSKTLPIALISFMSTHMLDWGKLAAGSVVLMIPGLIISLWAQKYLVSGLTAGAIK